MSFPIEWFNCLSYTDVGWGCHTIFDGFWDKECVQSQSEREQAKSLFPLWVIHTAVQSISLKPHALSPDSSPVVFIEHTTERWWSREWWSFSPYPSHLALPFLVPISPCALSLLNEDDWGRVGTFSINFYFLLTFSLTNSVRLTTRMKHFIISVITPCSHRKNIEIFGFINLGT